jgi:hypothetical protein
VSIKQKIKDWWGTCCTGMPDLDLHDECCSHDRGYERGGGYWQRVKLDFELAQGAWRKKHYILAPIMYVGVRFFSARLVAPIFNSGKQRFNWN